MNCKIVLLNSDSRYPTKSHVTDAGYDLFSTEDVLLKPSQRKVVKTGIKLSIPAGFYGRIAPRSGLAVKNGVDVLAGVIDSGYNGEIGVVLINTDKFESVSLPKSSRIAQLIFEKCEDMNFETVLSLDVSEREAGGFGSTGN
jgi:deoxyuridine 5'-triphosphate nucleotidohydrolase